MLKISIVQWLLLARHLTRDHGQKCPLMYGPLLLFPLVMFIKFNDFFVSKLYQNLSAGLFLVGFRKGQGYCCSLLIWLRNTAMSSQLLKHGTMGSRMSRLPNLNYQCLRVYFVTTLVRAYIGLAICFVDSVLYEIFFVICNFYEGLYFQIMQVGQIKSMD